MEGNNNEGNGLKTGEIRIFLNEDEKKTSEILKKFEGAREFPLKEILKIQEALKPLGYMIDGFRDGKCSDYGLLLYLTPGGCLPFRKDTAIPAGVNNIAGVAHNPDNGFHGSK